MHRFRFCVASVLWMSAAALAASAQSNPSFEYKPNTLGGPFVKGDFNGDGKLDLVAGSQFYAGNGDGTFQPAQTAFAASTAGVTSLVAADVNNDGKLDLVAIGNSGDVVNVYLGNGNGTFQQPITFTASAQPMSLAVGNFSGGSYNDIAVGDAVGSVEVFHNTNGRSFTLAQTVSLAPSNPLAVSSLVAGDVDQDGKTDLAASLGYGASVAGQAFVLWGLGNDSFQPVSLKSYPNGATAVNIADVNQDGAPDILATYSCNSAAVEAGRNSGVSCVATDIFYGGQGPKKTYARTAFTGAPLTGVGTMYAIDVNGDGITDLVTSGAGTSTYSGAFVWLGNTDGTFQQTAQQFITNSYSFSNLLPGDFNQDGMVDFVTNGMTLLNASISMADGIPPIACPYSQISPTVIVCNPVNNTYVPGNHINVAVSGYDKTPLTALQVYVDGNLVSQESITGSTQSSFETSLGLANGQHLIVAKGWDQSGISFLTSRTVTAYAGTPETVCSAALNSATICLPAQTTSGTVHVLANGYTSAIPTAVQLYIDGTLVVNTLGNGSSIDTTENLGAGSHSVVFKIWGADGKSYMAERNISVQ